MISQVTTWPSPPDDLRLGRDEVHVWCVPLNLPASQREWLSRTLSPDEHARADRFVFQKDRQHFIAARGALRVILGRFAGAAPGSLHFQYNPYGKPSLDGGHSGLRFNVAHSHGLALIAVTYGRAVGVDLERIRPDMSFEELARRFFSSREVADLLALPEPLRRQAFFACWTRKEAYVKARGEGLSIPLQDFDVSLTPGEPAALLRAEGDAPDRWSLRALDPGHGYAATLAVEGYDWRLKRWQWSAHHSVRVPGTA